MSLFFLTSFSLINFIYIKIWKKFSTKVPTGVGFLIIIPFFFYYSNEYLYFINIFLIFIFSLIYYLDDLIEIHFLWRILLQILASLVVCIFYIIDFNLKLIFLTMSTFLILVNTLNFQDGEDLNLATLLIIIFGIFYFYTENNFTQNISEVILLYLISFSLFNLKKENLYFGDSGCYVMSIIILLLINEESHNTTLIKSLIVIIIYPSIDLFYVVIYRILKKDNIFSRNYLHIYQITANKINSKVYLLPCILFSILNFFISSHFYLGMNLIIFLVTLNIILLFVTRLLLNKLPNYHEK